MRSLAVSLLLAAAACRHLPPDVAARAVAPPPGAAAGDAAGGAVERPIPERREIAGLWIALSLDGVFARLGSVAVYAFEEDGHYTSLFGRAGAAVSGYGTFRLERGRLLLDEGAVAFDARLTGDRLELRAPSGSLTLAPIPPVGLKR